jgi:transcriptional regulator with GAF, ATPase, and Fis domain
MQMYEGSSTDDFVPGLIVLFGASSKPLPGVFLLHLQSAVIGREPGVEVCIEVNAVSRRHAMLTLDGGQWRINDLASRNGTIVDGAFVSEAFLEHNCEVRIGDALFKFVEAGGRSYSGYRFDGTMEPGATRLARQATMLLGGAQMDRIVASLEKIAPTLLSVIIKGESGTGKEVAASEVHRLSGRKGQFIAVNCAAIPASLLESELFGYRKGAFSGADRDKMGLVKAANNGTLFLDEIGDMPIEAQAKLLRVLQSREVTPVGATAAEPVDVRIVCATHRDLASLQQRGTFRGDLFARLNEYSVTLPPLRDRKEDIFLLTRAMLARHGRQDLGLSFPFLVGLFHYDWPFNVRELEACIKRAVALASGPALEAMHLPDALREAMAGYGRRESAPPAAAGPPMAPGPPWSPGPPGPLPQPGRPQEPSWQPQGGFVPSGAPGGFAAPAAPRAQAPSEGELRALLSTHRGNVAAVGRVLGKERMQIHRWMKKYNIEIAEYRAG